jgi:4'-phosphopantetheinyl transferase
MNGIFWITSRHADVPAGDAWLSASERGVQAGLAVARRRQDWRLGRWTAKSALCAVLEAAPERIEVLAAADGAPEAFLDGRPARLGVSISHRAGRALAVVGPGEVGCDLELVEPRSDGFVEEFLAPAEQADVGDDRGAAVNLRWCAKEAAAKVRRQGLRLDVRRAVSRLAPGDGDWERLTVEWPGGHCTHGWWRSEPGWVMAVAAEPAPSAPQRL